ncbi:hypothetical protein PT7_1983 [Pusillimonas sp. T7-7]|nr:hypothetical protein PT7_1983 [Pusillimonas sp. T7-7]
MCENLLAASHKNHFTLINNHVKNYLLHRNNKVILPNKVIFCKSSGKLRVNLGDKTCFLP